MFVCAQFVHLKSIKAFASGSPKTDTLKAMSFLTSIELNYPGFLVEATRQVFLRIWSQKKPIQTEEDLFEIAEKIGLPEDERIIKASDGSRVKVTLRRQTKQALKMGAIAAPWILVKRPNKQDVNLFGGHRIHVIADLLGCTLPLRTEQSKL
uniref:DSBA domain-containing protein n=1 Tax=Steinernema glaseri TaxID=37863 RepID=A0A1I7Z5L8_9BILA